MSLSPDTKQADPRTIGDRPNASTPTSAATAGMLQRRAQAWGLA